MSWLFLHCPVCRNRGSFLLAAPPPDGPALATRERGELNHLGKSFLRSPKAQGSASLQPPERDRPVCHGSLPHAGVHGTLQLGRKAWVSEEMADRPRHSIIRKFCLLNLLGLAFKVWPACCSRNKYGRTHGLSGGHLLAQAHRNCALSVTTKWS